VAGISQVTRIWHTLVASAAVAIAVTAPQQAVAAKNPETIFKDAAQYTVYVETRIEVPFIEDYQATIIGAGFVIDRKRHWILTNAHVSGKSPASIAVAFSDGTRTVATPVYIDPYLDVAILAFEPPDQRQVAEAKLECKTTPGIGHPVGTFGHPEGLRFTGTRGIISGRTSQFDSDWLQTDAPISAGNSGGPLISLKTGRVVGINSASVEDNGAQNTNLAVLMTQACRIIDLLLAGKDPNPADVGATFFQFEGEPTLVVGQLREQGAKIGLQRGDQLLLVNGRPLPRATEGELMHRLRGQGGRADLRIRRAGVEIDISATLQLQPSLTERRGIYIAGALFAPTHYDDIQSVSLAPTMMVHSVEDGSIAEAAGIYPYDHLIGINNQPVRSLEDLQGIIDSLAPDTSAALDLVRFIDGEKRFLDDILAKMPLDDAQWIGFE
jgi:S1-C subfamily serine protease